MVRMLRIHLLHLLLSGCSFFFHILSVLTSLGAKQISFLKTDPFIGIILGHHYATSLYFLSSLSLSIQG